MIGRRDILFGGGMLAAAGAAYALTPRDKLNLMGGRKLESIVPAKIGSWTETPSNAFVLPKSEGSLADRLYNQQLNRLYLSADRLPMMLVIAYGEVQNDALQLHRPEVCYTAVGFAITQSLRRIVALGGGAALPVRELTATSESRVEPIVYWTRIGDDLPTDGREQRAMKLGQQLRGVIADGVLVRVSTVATPSAATFAALREFAATLVATMAPADRAVLIGRPLAAGVAAAR